ncbi:MAG: hypothetical protein HQL42_20040 [Alphaproteobacteria bacterium]|nr:hypothetical protein [Alphaproteobacteria bacterium]
MHDFTPLRTIWRVVVAGGPATVAKAAAEDRASALRDRAATIPADFDAGHRWPMKSAGSELAAAARSYGEVAAAVDALDGSGPSAYGLPRSAISLFVGAAGLLFGTELRVALAAANDGCAAASAVRQTFPALVAIAALFETMTGPDAPELVCQAACYRLEDRAEALTRLARTMPGAGTDRALLTAAILYRDCAALMERQLEWGEPILSPNLTVRTCESLFAGELAVASMCRAACMREND